MDTPDEAPRWATKADADGTGYLPMLRQPVLVLAGPAELLRAAHTRALERSLTAVKGARMHP
jgi:hypothetical protein